ncbi:rna 3 -terminal phosphate cyclase-like protein [Cystoisospora suis]|uniref:Rna 3-terminal phosphate cyclase-like protein n=1 Tax=Cystoisospora suis TaxID=483139 RepID=A0A2C6LCQ9_9APIC|nr:rna 3 -terminal phosphate cyclase-like protein [Cystoisospora suis]
MHLLHYSGSGFFRQRVLLATLTARPIQISKIREDSSDSPGLKPYEASLLRLLCAITFGSRVHIDATGTVLTYTPGQLAGADPENPISLKHACHPGRGISYYLETLLLLAPFCKNPLSITLTGVTDGTELDCSVDVTRSVTVPTLHKILALAAGGSRQQEGQGGADGEQGVGSGASVASSVSFQVKILRRGFPPKGGGEVHVHCSGVLNKAPQPFTLLDVGRVKRIRGIAFAENVSPILARRCITKIRQIFNDFLPDVWVYMDTPTRRKQGQTQDTGTGEQQTDKPRRGVGVTLVAETIKGNFKGASASVVKTGDSDDSLSHKQKAADASRATGNSKLRLLLEEEAKMAPEERKASAGDEFEMIGELAARRLLLEIQQGGVVDTSHQYMALLFAAAADEYQPSKLRLSQLTPYTIQFIRHLRDFLGVTFHFEHEVRGDDNDSPEVDLKCVGAGLRNTARKTF